MRHESHGSVAACATEDVCRLLVRGDAQERVWAAWSLAQRDARLARDRVSVAFQHDTDLGVRRHMLVVLAGLGQRDLVLATARDEPASRVRAEATRYLARLADPHDVDAFEVLATRAIDISAAVRAAFADAVRPDASPAMIERVVGLLFDPDVQVRELARARFEGGDLPRAPVAAALEALDRLGRTPASSEQDDTVRALALYRPPPRSID